MRRRYLGAALALALATALGVVALAPTAGAGTTRTYIVLYKQHAVANDAATRIQSAGGTLVASYSQIGVAIARSSNNAFATTMKKDLKIKGVSSTERFGVQLPDQTEQGSDATADEVETTAWGDSLSNLQWDMTQIHAPEAQAINPGSQTVLVGDIDTGLDFTHPDIAPNYDAANSADCTSGDAEELLPGNDADGHGTHTAGTIAAAANGIGIVGVAPNVKIAGIRASGITPDGQTGFFFPEAVVCSFMWAGTHGVDVTNNSYFADPWLFNCKNDPEQRAIWDAERRAIKFAQQNGVVVVAASGNFSDDLANPTRDITSPDFPLGSEVDRTVTNACAVVPVEVPGVVGVNANGNQVVKSFYSNYGYGVTDVIAPGGDSLFFTASPDVPNGRVLSTWPQSLAADCPRPVVDTDGTTYCYLQGTSMASPHVTGVVALIMSQFPGISTGAAMSMLRDTADPLACPTAEQMTRYADFPSVNNGAPQVCTGDVDYNSFNGNGQVNALTAVGG
ncbi:MAG TPA: S8 family serine peptidase [Actinomycetota bacterium]